MKISVSVRHAAIEDAADLARMHRATWQHAYRDVLPASFLQSLDTTELEPNWEKDITKYQEAGNHIMLADTEHGAQGFVMFGRGHEGVTTPATGPGHKLGQIYSLYVMPNFQKHGLGKTMMEIAFEVLGSESYTEVYLTTFEANVAAHRFYERQGGINAGVETIAEIGGENVLSRAYWWPLTLQP